MCRGEAGARQFPPAATIVKHRTAAVQKAMQNIIRSKVASATPRSQCLGTRSSPTLLPLDTRAPQRGGCGGCGGCPAAMWLHSTPSQGNLPHIKTSFCPPTLFLSSSFFSPPRSKNRFSKLTNGETHLCVFLDKILHLPTLWEKSPDTPAVLLGGTCTAETRGT